MGSAARGWEGQRWMLARVKTLIGRRFRLRGPPGAQHRAGGSLSFASYVGVAEERDPSDAFQESHLELTFMTGA
ncbi:hypothetical protein GCM10023323_10180 [Streptomyces thinghirensis]|uniref:Uncharacterized protein n=1 Tax=Streptomyces thinghirensis TaxID=551547 RepID=A0ABP9SW72_9ACTN